MLHHLRLFHLLIMFVNVFAGVVAEESVEYLKNLFYHYNIWSTSFIDAQ
jgi:hypothetical protein